METVEQLKDLIANEITLLTGKLSNIFEGITATGMELNGKAKTTIEITIRASLSEINKWAEAAKKKAIDVTECIGINLDIIKDLPAINIVDLNKCPSDNIRLAQNIIHDTADGTEKLLDNVDDILRNLQECGTNLICLTRVSILASKVIIKIARGIGTLSVDAIQNFVNIGKDATTCIADIVARVTSTAGSITSTTVTCIQTKMGVDEFEFRKERSVTNFKINM